MRRTAVPPAGPHGDDAGRVAAALGLAPHEVLDLATSLNPVAPDVRLVVAGALDSLRSYPDAAFATAALSEAIGLRRGQLLLTNGGAEAIALVGAELGRGWIDEPDFSLYRRHLSEVAPDAPTWRSNPHNPSGRLAPAEARAAVWDEAFYPLATGCWTRGDLRAGSIVVGSLTKLFACPGLRLGYVASEDSALIARLAERQPRWSVSSPALSALPSLLRSADLPAWSKQVGVLRLELCDVLRRPVCTPIRLTPTSSSSARPPDCATGSRGEASSCATAPASPCRRRCASPCPPPTGWGDWPPPSRDGRLTDRTPPSDSSRSQTAPLG